MTDGSYLRRIDADRNMEMASRTRPQSVRWMMIGVAGFASGQTPCFIFACSWGRFKVCALKIGRAHV